jgi:glycosyltransferase involved in cell wall biosynthesis
MDAGCILLSKKQLSGQGDVWYEDELAVQAIQKNDLWPKLVHGYGGSFPKTCKILKERGAKISWTVAAHDVGISKREHEKLGIPFSYPHLTEPELWNRYIDGYRQADLLITPGEVPKKTLIKQGFSDSKIKVIPHGCPEVNLEEIKPLPDKFVVGYLGVCGGADKGLRYLLEAWKLLNYRDGSRLVLAGRDSESAYVRGLVEMFGGGSITLAGWQYEVSDFYNQLTCYVQPSCTEGFGCEVPEAMSYSRVVLCSRGAGASDLVSNSMRFDFCNTNDLAGLIDFTKTSGRDHWLHQGAMNREESIKYFWDRIRCRYVETWSCEFGEQNCDW